MFGLPYETWVLKNIFFVFQCPDTVEERQQVADGFQAQWDFPNCLGALDEKHINIRPPPRTGSTYYNYKHTFSIVLMALVDSN